MSRVVATLLNFFLPGLGYLAFGPDLPKRAVGLVWALAMAGLTFVELSVKTAAPDLYLPMFVSVFAFNTAFAVDTWRTLGRAG